MAPAKSILFTNKFLEPRQAFYCSLFYLNSVRSHKSSPVKRTILSLLGT